MIRTGRCSFSKQNLPGRKSKKRKILKPGYTKTANSTELAVFYEIAESWKELIGSSNCIIAKDERDMEHPDLKRVL